VPSLEALTLVVEQVLEMQEVQQELAAAEHQKVQRAAFVQRLVTELPIQVAAVRVLIHCLTTLHLQVLAALELLLFDTPTVKRQLLQ
jgi:hypothetical protein